LLSVEGINGVGKTYLTGLVVDQLTREGRQPPVVLEEFSRRCTDTDLGRRLLGTLVQASGGERFLRAGYPGSETLLLLAIKTHDYESVLDLLAAGRTVIEGRSLHSIAVYQSLISHPDDEGRAYGFATTLLHLAEEYRPLPDRTVLLTDDVETAVRRAEARNQEAFTAEQWVLHHRASALFERLAAAAPDRILILDRRQHDAASLTTAMIELLDTAAHATGPSRTRPAASGGQ
jgi:dTMP kinase